MSRQHRRLESTVSLPSMGTGIAFGLLNPLGLETAAGRKRFME